MKSMTYADLEKALGDIYKKYEMDVEGEDGGYRRDFICTKPCCYDRPERIHKAKKEVKELFDEELEEVSSYVYFEIYPGDYFSISSLISAVKRAYTRYEQKHCTHEWSEGVSSNTSAGPKTVYECQKCGKTEYRSVKG